MRRLLCCYILCVQAQALYTSDSSFSQYFLQHNKRLGDMIKRVQNY